MKKPFNAAEWLAGKVDTELKRPIDAKEAAEKTQLAEREERDRQQQKIGEVKPRSDQLRQMTRCSCGSGRWATFSRNKGNDWHCLECDREIAGRSRSGIPGRGYREDD